jgi:uncharacterized membrane protein HdeD (DUF308 family)
MTRMSATTDDLFGPPLGERPEPQSSLPDVTRLAGHWGLVLAYGVLCLVLGLLLAVWPRETLTLSAVLIAVQLLVSGVLRLVMAIGARGIDGGVRVLLGLSGGLALVVGLLCLRDPVQTLLYVSILFGAWCVLSGVIDIMSALMSRVHGRRALDGLTGLATLLVGGFLLVNPELSLGVFVVTVAVLMFLTGGVAVVAALRLRGELRHEAPSAAGPPAGLPAV